MAHLLKILKKEVIAWCLYDWANSAFPAIVLTFVFSAYFTSKVAINKITGTSNWGFTVGIASLIIAISSPLLGAIADHEGRRKPWIFIFTALTVISSALLWFSKPQAHYAAWTLTWVALGIIGVEVAEVFYNAMLYDIAPKKYVGRISGWGWGFGYFGGLFSLVIALFVFIQKNWLGFDLATFESVRACGPLVAVWTLIFSVPLFIITPDRPTTGIAYRIAVGQGLKQLLHTLRTLPEYREILKFLLARMLYIDGLNTIFAFGGIYAAGTFHMSFSQIVLFGICMNMAAGTGAWLFAWLDDYWGSKKTILIVLGGMAVLTAGILIAKTQLSFWILGMGLSMGVGPAQAASRSFLVHIAPPPVITEMFGLFAFSGKATAFLGPWLVGLLTLLFNSQRIGMSAVIFFLVIGALLLLAVKETEN